MQTARWVPKEQQRETLRGAGPPTPPNSKPPRARPGCPGDHADYVPKAEPKCPPFAPGDLTALPGLARREYPDLKLLTPQEPKSQGQRGRQDFLEWGLTGQPDPGPCSFGLRRFNYASSMNIGNVQIK